MNRELLDAQWVHSKEFLKERWPNLTDEDIRQINGRMDQLISKLQQRYGYSKEQVENEISKVNVERGAKPAYSGEKTTARSDDRFARREAVKDDSSFLKWLLGLAIAALLLSLYFNMPKTNEPATPTTPRSAQENVMTTTPADQNLVQSIRQSLFANSALASDLQNVRISASNGDVTISGTVANDQQREDIGNMIQKFSGVNHVNNKLTVRP